jgi:phage gp36-like protein
MFLLWEDYLTNIRGDILQLLVNLDNETLQQAGEVARAEMASYLCLRYSEGDILPMLSRYKTGTSYSQDDQAVFSYEHAPIYGIAAWDSTTAYAQDDLVTSYYRIYRGLTAGNQGNEPRTSPADWAPAGGVYVAQTDNPVGMPPVSPDWQEHDPRNALVVKHSVSLAVYELSKRQPSRQVPEIVVTAYEEARSFLQEAKQGRFQLLSKDLEEPETRPQIKIRSNPPWRGQV